MSINDAPEIRALFKNFVIHEVATSYSMPGRPSQEESHRTPDYELLNKNGPDKPAPCFLPLRGTPAT